MRTVTREYGWAVAAAQWREATGQTRTPIPLGQKIFESTCGACHAVGRVLVGPTVTEIATIYAGNPGGIVAWTDAPGKKREGFPPMPAFKLGRENLLAVANYMLELASDKAEAADPGAKAAVEEP